MMTAVAKMVELPRGASDVWLIGANEPFALEGSVPTSSGYISARRVPLPLPEGHGIHAFKLENGCATVLMAPGLPGEAMEGLKDGMLQKFLLYGLEEDDIRAARFQAEGAPVPFKFKFPAVFHGHDPRVEGYNPVLRNFDWQEGDKSDSGKFAPPSILSDAGIFGRDRCGQLLLGSPEFALNKIPELQEGGEPKPLATWKAVGHVGHTCQALGDRLLLMPTRSGEDAFYESMQLIEWPTQSQVREIPLEFSPSYIEGEWPRGILSGSTQTFFTCHETDDKAQTVFEFATPRSSGLAGEGGDLRKSCKNWKCSDATKWVHRADQNALTNTDRKGWSDEECCEKLICLPEICDPATAWKPKKNDGTLQGSTFEQCCDRIFCEDFVCDTDVNKTGKGTQWYKKVDTNHYKWQGSTNEECCQPKYCSQYQTSHPTRWRRKSDRGALGSTDVECY
ncbi:unnamed protein product, partial [Symbiodinium sp. KB8]